MLSDVDARLVEGDPSVPGMATLLDNEAFADILRRMCPSAGVTNVKSNYLRYKPKTSCLVGYEAKTESGDDLRLYARAHGTQSDFKLQKAEIRKGANDHYGNGIILDPDNAIVIYLYPSDHELRTLRRLNDDNEKRKLVIRIIGSRSKLRYGTFETLRYKPERRYVARIQTRNNKSALLKMYCKSDYEIVDKNATVFASQGILKTAKQLGSSRRYSAMLLKWIDGNTPEHINKDGKYDSVLYENIGNALSEVHAQKPELQLEYSKVAYLRSVLEAVEAARVLCPNLDCRFENITSVMSKKISSVKWNSKAIHGDFSIDQIIKHEDKIAVLDFDRAGYGDPRMDFGMFAARTIYETVDTRKTIHNSMNSLASLLNGYKQGGNGTDTSDIQLFVAASMLKMIAEPFRYRLINWPVCMGKILSIAEEVISHDWATS